MKIFRMLCGIALLAALQLSAQQAPGPVIASAKLTGELEKRLADQTTATLTAMNQPFLAGDALKGSAGDVEKKWEDTLHEKLSAQLKKVDGEVLGFIALSDGDASARLSGAAAKARKAIDDRLSKALETKAKEVTKSLETEATRAKTLEDAQKIVVDALKPGLEEREANLLLALSNAGTAAESAAVQAKLDAERAAMQTEFLEQFTKEKGLSKVVRCQVTSLTTSTPNLTCEPDGLHLGGMSIAHIRISGLPANQDVTVRADLTETPDSRTSSRSGKTTGENISRDGQTTSNTDLCVDPYDGKCDSFTFPKIDDASGSRDVVVLVHTARVVSPTYATQQGDSFREAMKELRKPGTNRQLQLVSRGKGLELGLLIIIGNTKVLSTSIPVAYERWKFETGTMFAVSNLVDQELVTSPDSATTGNTKVESKRDADSMSQETVLFLNLVPANYEFFSIGFGLHSSSDRSVAYYLGGSVRLLSLGERALASFSAGMVGAQVRQFPDVAKGNSLPANDPLLQGDLRYKTGWYAGISLGFRFGPLGGGGDQTP
jgi:hypothetical protein